MSSLAASSFGSKLVRISLALASFARASSRGAVLPPSPAAERTLDAGRAYVSASVSTIRTSVGFRFAASFSTGRAESYLPCRQSARACVK